jgi:two-component system, OmpR family, phosphate regulon sensor histidine kinase PhoR
VDKHERLGDEEDMQDLFTGYPRKAIVSALADGALIVDAGNLVVAANAIAEDILQLKPEGLSATSVLRAPMFAQALASVRMSKEPISLEAEFRGTPVRQVSLQLATLGQSGDVLVLLRDFTREQAVEKMRSDFVANASHEMRTPLASIIGCIETLQGAAKNDVKARDIFLGTMLTQAQRMKLLIDDLLTLSRIELNAHIKPNTKASLINVARQAKSNLEDAAKKANVAVILKSNDRIDVAGDADQLLQVAQNLLENAIKYGSSGGRIELECYASDGVGFLAVRDFGQGIAETHLPRLTERFYRVSTQESRSLGGTGLGLAIVKHIMLRHRGKLAVSSKVGEGATFTVSVPLAT